MAMQPTRQFIAWFETLRKEDVARVGGKNASLGELVQQLAAQGVRVPDAFGSSRWLTILFKFRASKLLMFCCSEVG